MKSLTGFIWRENNPRFTRMPCRIYRRSKRGISTHVHFFGNAVANNHCSAMRTAYVEKHILCGIVLIVMAIDAMVVFVLKRTVVFINCTHIETWNFALVKPKLPVNLITRLNQTITNIIVNRIRRNGYFEILITFPLFLFLCVNLYVYIFSLWFCKHFMPLFFGNVRFSIFVCVYFNGIISLG